MARRGGERAGDVALVTGVWPNACVKVRGHGAATKYAIVRYWALEGERLALAGVWCKSEAGAWASAARRIRERRDGPGGNGNG